MTDDVTVKQPTAAPTRKMEGVGYAALLGPVIALGVTQVFPDITESCGKELGMALTIGGVAAAQGIFAFVWGYFRRERA